LNASPAATFTVSFAIAFAESKVASERTPGRLGHPLWPRRWGSQRFELETISALTSELSLCTAPPLVLLATTT
ncbi:MAG: hypothetical protein WBC92_13870, partial [Terracidiphilus sp.]